MKKKYIVTLTEEERQMLQEMLSRGKAAARKLMHARILLKADAAPGGPGWNDDGHRRRAGGRKGDRRAGAQGVCGRRSGGGVGTSQASAPVSSGSWMETAKPI